MNYDGGKNGEGVYQAIINQMPPHRVYIEAFLGSGAIIRRKRPATVNIGIELDPITIASVKPLLTTVDVIEGDAMKLIPSIVATVAAEDVLIYADPPYLMETRSCKQKLYRREFSTVKEHTTFLQLAKSVPAMWIISGYWHALYTDMLSDWRVVKYWSPTRSGMREECLWCNFPEPVQLHDYQYLGRDNTERQRIRRKKARWQNRLAKMNRLERMAVLSAIEDFHHCRSHSQK